MSASLRQLFGPPVWGCFCFLFVSAFRLAKGFFRVFRVIDIAFSSIWYTVLVFEVHCPVELYTLLYSILVFALFPFLFTLIQFFAQDKSSAHSNAISNDVETDMVWLIGVSPPIDFFLVSREWYCWISLLSLSIASFYFPNTKPRMFLSVLGKFRLSSPLTRI